MPPLTMLGTAPNRLLPALARGGGPRGSRRSAATRQREWLVKKRKPSGLFRLTEQSQSGLASGQAHPPGLVMWGELETTSVRGFR